MIQDYAAYLRKCLLPAIMLPAGVFFHMAGLHAQCVADTNSLGGSGVFVNGSQLNVGIPTTKTDQSYTWKKGNTTVKGPVTGTGDNLSFTATATSPDVAGTYTVITTKDGCSPATFGHVVVYYVDSVSGLQVNNILANSATLQWASAAPGANYEYQVTTDPNDYSSSSQSTDTVINLSALSGGVTYYVAVRVRDAFGSAFTDWDTLSFTTKPGPCSAIPGTFGGGGAFCVGGVANFSMFNTTADQQYSILLNGNKVYGPVPGTGNSLSYSVTVTGPAQAGVYTAVASKTGCIDAPFGKANVYAVTSTVTGLSIQSFNEVSVTFKWNGGSPGEQFEYDVNEVATPPATYGFPQSDTTGSVSNLKPNTTYYIYVRPVCNSGGFTPVTISFKTTAVVAPNCATAQPVSLCTAVMANIPAGGGAWKLTGTYPVNSVGSVAGGKELIYSFTPTESAVYYIEELQDISSIVDYLYKPLSDGCTNTGWTGIGSSPLKGAIGYLTAGTTYLLLLDNESFNAVSVPFRICKATVTTPAADTCSLQLYYTKNINGPDPKEEFIINARGNLVGSVDYSKITNAPGAITISKFVASGPLRYTQQNEEMMNRSLTFAADNAPDEPIKIKIFFTDDDLKQLTGNPKDGTGDVYDAGNLQGWQVEADCPDAYANQNSPQTLPQLSTGRYQGSAGFIQFETPLLSNFTTYTYFLIGGGCSSTLPVLVSDGPPAVCSGSKLGLTAQGGSVFQWFKNAVLIPDSSGPHLTVTDTGTYTVRTVAAGACTPLTSQPLVIGAGAALPAPIITALSGTNLCSGDSVKLSSSADSANQWYRDGVLLPGATGKTYTANTQGSYMVIAQNSGACKAGFSNAIQVNTKAAPSGHLIQPAGKDICEGSFILLSADGGASYQWYFNGTVVSGETTATLKAAQAGVYKVKIISSEGCVNMLTDSVVLRTIKKPTASFSFDNACVGATVHFTNTSVVPATGTTSYIWLFPGGTSTLANPDYQFTTAGAAAVSLIVSSSQCGTTSDTATQTITISTPIAGVTYPLITAGAGLPVTLNARPGGTAYEWQPPTDLNNATVQSPVMTPTGDRLYTIFIKMAAGCITKDTQEVRIVKEKDIYVPKAFTPNNDGHNDRLFPFLVNIKTLRYFRVYNRWGNVVYESTDGNPAKGWDGTVNGQPLPQGTYSWTAAGIDSDNALLKRSGAVILIR